MGGVFGDNKRSISAWPETYNTFDDAYPQILKEIMSDGRTVKVRGIETREITPHLFCILDTKDVRTRSPIRAVNYTYADNFLKWILSGDDVMPDSIRPRGAKFDKVDLTPWELPESFSTFYGPRISSQLDQIVEELTEDIYSRRTTVSILDADDNKLLTPLREGLTTVEYPCTQSLTFRYVDGRLDLYVNMRSQNAVMVLPFDVYNFAGILSYVTKSVNIERKTFQKGDPVKIHQGRLYNYAVSQHVFDSQYEFCDNIVNAWEAM